MAVMKAKTELAQRCPPPPCTRWDQRVKPVLLSYLTLNNGKKLCLSLQTQDPDTARRHMRLLVEWSLAKGRLSPDSGAAKAYGPKRTGRSWLKKVNKEIRRLNALSETGYGKQALATARRWDRPVGIIHHLAGRKPETSAGTYATRRMRARERGQRMPMGNTWEHRRQGGRYFFWNTNVLTARLQIDSRSWQWPLRVDDEEKAEALMAPVRVSRERLHQAAAEALNYELGTIAAEDAAMALAGARAQLALAIVAAGGPERAAEFVRKGPQEKVRSAAVSDGGKHADPLEPLIEDRSATTRARNDVRAVAPRHRARSSPALERASGAIKELYPEGVPEQAAEPNVRVYRRVGEKLSQAGLPGVSDDTILRAAGRRK